MITYLYHIIMCSLCLRFSWLNKQYKIFIGIELGIHKLLEYYEPTQCLYIKCCFKLHYVRLKWEISHQNHYYLLLITLYTVWDGKNGLEWNFVSRLILGCWTRIRNSFCNLSPSFLIQVQQPKNTKDVVSSQPISPIFKTEHSVIVIWMKTTFILV